MKGTLPPITRRPKTTGLDAALLREEIVLRARAGAGLAEIDRALIEPAAVDEDEKAALWLLAWCSLPEGGAACRR
jgi:hypothetical protein